MIKNRYAALSNYRDDILQNTLDEFAASGYKIASVTLLPDLYGSNVLYIFFTKETKNE